MPNDVEGVGRLLARRELPEQFERWRLRLPAGASRLTSAEEWAGALVLVERGRLEAECTVGGTRTFREGDLLALGWLPLRRLINIGEEDLELLAVRRRDVGTTEPYLHVVRAPAATTMRRGPKPSRRAQP